MVLAVGLALVLAAAAARGMWRSRALLGAAGVAWLAASPLPAAVLVHQAVLVLLLVGYPDGWPRGRFGWLLAATAVPIALLLLPQPVVAVLFAAVAVHALVEVRPDPPARLFPVVMGTAIAAVLGGSWAWSRLAPSTFDPATALLAYEVVLLASAAGFVVASWIRAADPARLADRLLREDRPVDLDGLAQLLAEVLRDAQLSITRADENPPADDVAERTPRRRLPVRDGQRLIADVWHRSAALDDEPVAHSVAGAVRLVALHLEGREQLEVRTEDLRQARSRVLAAADRQQTATAAQLRTDVVQPLAATAADLRSDHLTAGDPVTAQAVEVAAGELVAAVEEIRRLVAGRPSSVLGGGRLVGAVQDLARRSPVPTSVSGVAAADPDREVALFYVCSEALVNAEKHAGASRLTVDLLQDDRSVVLTVTDDGRGGADPAGSGLSGLADRLAVYGGRLRVESPLGAGTILTATLPRQAIFR